MTNLRPLSPALTETAKRECNEDPTSLREGLQQLRDWLSKQPHIRARTDDQSLVAFLRGCKYSLKRAQDKIEAYYTMRTAMPEIFANRDPAAPDVLRVVKAGLFLPLGEDIEGRRVILVRTCCYDPAEVTGNDIFRVLMMILDILHKEDDTFVINGVVAVLDFSGMTMTHATHVSPMLAKRAMNFFQEAYPLRPRALHWLNLTSIFEKIFKLFKSFMKEKLHKRLFFHSDVSTLYPTIPREVLPNEYGGSAGTLQELGDRWAAKLEDCREYFAEEANYGVDESKRPGKSQGQRDVFGVDGSFRTLNVD